MVFRDTRTQETESWTAMKYLKQVTKKEVFTEH